jgi:two-component sensor histidine kinase
MAVASFGQDISGKEADSLLNLLTVSRTNKDRIDIFFTLAQFHLFKAGEDKMDLDSAKNYIDQAKVLNSKLRSADADGFCVLLESLLSREKAQIKEGKALAEKAVSMLEKGKNKYYLGKAYFALSDYYDYTSTEQLNEKIRLTELAYNSFKQSGHIERQAFTLTFMADLYQLNDEFTKAREKLDTALILYKSIKHEKLQSVYALYASIYYNENLFKQALNYSLMALKNATSTGDTTITICQINNRIGITLIQLKEPEKAIEHFLVALKIAGKYNDNNSGLILMLNTVHTYIELKKPEKALNFMKVFPEKLLLPKTEADYIYTTLCYLLIYTELKRYDEAQVYANEMLQLIKLQEPESSDMSNFYTSLAKYYLDSRQYMHAGIYVSKSDSSTRKSGGVSRRKVAFQLKFRLDTALHHYKSAIANLLEYEKMKDSIFNETNNKQIKQLEIEYETEKNKNEITGLNQKNQAQQNRLDREKLIGNFTIAGLVLLTIIIGLLYRQYRLKQQSSKVILHKNKQLQHLLTEKEWLVKEIHHRVKNNFHIVASLLEIQSSYLKNKEALSAIKQSQDRIHSMSIIHQKLYQSETLSTIHMPEYIYELVEYLRESYGIRENIRFELNIEKIELNHASAITLGLILNEAITNAIKYAFTGNEEGKISISLSHISDSQISLIIADNGRGLPIDFDSKIGASMGMELLQGLTDDLGGNFSIETKQGTQIKIIFQDSSIDVSDTSFRS